jgi:hypothetical protein
MNDELIDIKKYDNSYKIKFPFGIIMFIYHGYNWYSIYIKKMIRKLNIILRKKLVNIIWMEEN